MKKITVRVLALLSVMFLAVSCSNDSLYDDVITSNEIPSDRVINVRGALDGVTYSINNVALNSDLVILNNTNSKLNSTAQDLEDGLIKLIPLSSELSAELVQGKILYVNFENYTALRKIETVSFFENQGVDLRTSQAQLGEVFEGGVINFSVDLQEVARNFDENSPIIRSVSSGKDYYYDILNLDGNYNKWGFDYNPATNVSMAFNISMSFAKKQLLPTQFSTIFELNTNINPSLKFSASLNKVYSDDFVHYLPESILNELKGLEFDIDIPINTLGIESLPARIKVGEINLPTTIETNLSKESNFSYGVNGILKLGYIVDIDGFDAKITPVYENLLEATSPSTLNLNGELLTSSEVIISPEISIIDNSYNVSGELRFGVKTESNGNINLPGQTPIFGTKGVFSSAMDIQLDLVIMKLPIQILNDEKVLWNEGTVDRTITYSDLTWNVTSTNSINLLNNTRSYATDFTLNYKYLILGKLLPNQLFISYDVYQKNGTSNITSVQGQSITPRNLTPNSFTFTLNIPYKKTGGIFSSNYETESYLKNIVIRDSKGYIYEGILNTSINVKENSFLIKR